MVFFLLLFIYLVSNKMYIVFCIMKRLGRINMYECEKKVIFSVVSVCDVIYGTINWFMQNASCIKIEYYRITMSCFSFSYFISKPLRVYVKRIWDIQSEQRSTNPLHKPVYYNHVCMSDQKTVSMKKSISE